MKDSYIKNNFINKSNRNNMSYKSNNKEIKFLIYISMNNSISFGDSKLIKQIISFSFSFFLLLSFEKSQHRNIDKLLLF